ncbi:hypothetical protein BGY98DRAFT_1190076 [Russula aff. rugulosa BPL654]|nr:hypothetical protein BGY98DRAFT_1190076 [Russula aff. rugulosa BPL654]
MSLLAGLLAVSFFFPGFVIATISAPDCSLTWEWSFNSLGQNACMVAALMMSTCDAGSFAVGPLQPGESYPGPSGTDNSNLCKCSTVGYSLISACTGCQGERWIRYWSEYVTNCTKTLPPSSFPNPIPSGTRVPQWALLDVTEENFWNANESYVVGDSPEADPGKILGLSDAPVSASGPTSAFGAPSSITTMPASMEMMGNSSNCEAIICGITGGIAAIFIILVAVLFFYRRRRRSLVSPLVFDGDIGFNPHMDQVSRSASSPETVSSCFPETPASPLRPYYLDCPNMYSEFEVTSPPPAYISGVPSFELSPNRSPYTVGAMPNSQVTAYPLPDFTGTVLNRSQ